MTDHPDQNQGVKSRFSITLQTISFSHYNEKARWALDYYRVPYVEHKMLPALHGFTMFWYRSKEPGFEETPYVTPFMMAIPTEKVSGKVAKPIRLHDSTKIVEFASDQFASQPGSIPTNLYTNDPATKEKILALEERIDIMVGTHVRRWIYYELLFKSPRSVTRGLGKHGNAAKLQSWLWPVVLPVFSLFLRNHLNINEKTAAESKDIIRREFEDLSRMLEESGRTAGGGPSYFFENRFTAADLTFACLGGVMVGVNHEHGYGAWLPPLTQLRPEAQAFTEELRQTTAGKHALECYRLHRGSKVPGSSYGTSLFGLW
ncbi:hypothetical protein BGX34_011108 [Mortierella sp. NVP85]|nr:hypothetical protein BGX34_011108 [Mortierella sp. NVP85]